MGLAQAHRPEEAGLGRRLTLLADRAPDLWVRAQETEELTRAQAKGTSRPDGTAGRRLDGIEQGGRNQWELGVVRVYPQGPGLRPIPEELGGQRRGIEIKGPSQVQRQP